MEKYCISLHRAGVKKKGFSLSPITLKIPTGYIICLKGANGAGKTTFLRLLLGREKGAFGEIKILGKTMPIERVDILQQVGFVSEDNDFFHELSPLENEAQYAHFYSHWDGQLYRKKLKEFGIGFSEKISSLSKGNKVRFQLAFALSHNPKILLMDEPTAGLDPVFRTFLYKLLRELIFEREITVIFSTHLSEEIGEVADYLLEINKGKVSLRENWS